MIVLQNIKKMKKIKELQKRGKLGEGRNFGIGFSILNKKNDKFETYLPFTACRDYLNDFSYVEYTKKEIGTIYGYNHKLLNCFHNKRIFYLGVNTLDYNNYGGEWIKKEEALQILVNNHKFLERFLNNIEQEVGIKGRTKISLDEDVLIIKAPIYWSKTTALISAYTLLIRCFFNIKEEDLQQSMEDLMNNHKCFIQDDSYMKKSCIEFYNKLKTDKFDKVNYANLKITSASSVHNFGIQGYLSMVK